MNKKILPQIINLNLLLITALILSISTAVNLFAADVDIDATSSDADCFWADGPGTELYVPSGKTCTLTGTNTALNITDFTSYAVIVYSGGTLNIGNDITSTSLTI